ncbi:E3 ubiquitin-protein ligase synoviolin B-like isoform X2 [Xenia sp. Carnegie-2017]|uniref:E3 ubiquitin-protein ligase synoviolin B-like isoform X2 n=1 Tax=Xenia sp. Carnegie-2017 TaxID=2897299 RepID=UPI001F041EAD|nr:E3 ubiquitin-protein ligase synoviolin B-like isoform X2 [Xenia sp. Carnegie-2017]
MRGWLLSIGSIVLTCLVLGNAYHQKRQFYPSVVYITKSNPSLAVLYLQAFVFVLLLGQLSRKMFFGQLRAAETEHLIERSWYAVTETCLAFTVFRDNFSPLFVAQFTMLLFLKCFHWLSEDRVEYMERSPLISFLFHFRVLSLLTLLGTLDSVLIHKAYHSILTSGASTQLVFGFEYAILLTIVVAVFMKYVLHTIDLQSPNPWENKAVCILYSELIMGFIKSLLYIIFMLIMVRVHTFPLFAIRPMYLTFRSFKKSVSDVIMSRRAILNMNTLYPDATPEELANGDNVCIICREEMTGQAKKLPCNHIFHVSCLRSWFQRQQTCPTCRMDVLQPPRVTQPAPPAGVEVPPQAGGGPPPFPMFPRGFFPPGAHPVALQAGIPVPPPPAPPFTPGQVPPPPFAAGQVPPPPPFAPGQVLPPPFAPGQVPQPPLPGQAPQPAAPGQVPTSSASSSSQSPFPNMVPGFLPPFLPPFPILPPMLGFQNPMNASNINPCLSLEELQLMEGVERRNVEARIAVLKNIHSLLDAAISQLNQYSKVVTGKPPSTFTPDAECTAGTSSASNVAPEGENLVSSTADIPGPSMTGTIDDVLTSTSDVTQPKPEPIIAENANKENLESSNDDLRQRRILRFSSRPDNEDE